MSPPNVIARSESTVAVGTGLSASPPHRSRRAAFPHRAPLSGDTVAPFGVWATHAVAQQDRAGTRDTLVRFGARGVFAQPVSPRAGAFPPAAPPPIARPCSRTSPVLRSCPTSHARASSASAPRLPDAGRPGIRPTASHEISQSLPRRRPGFRRVPFLRDVVSDHGRASAPRIAVPHMLPSTLLTGSASANFELSRLNSTPHRIVVYASQPPSPTTTQHSLPGARYDLPGPDLHRLDRASFLAHKQSRAECIYHRPDPVTASGGMRSFRSGWFSGKPAMVLDAQKRTLNSVDDHIRGMS